jgi:predicted thioesterase
VSIEPGIERTDEFTAEDRLLTDVAGALGVKVLDGRKLRYAVEVREGERTIGVGTHERRVVDRAGFGR